MTTDGRDDRIEVMLAWLIAPVWCKVQRLDAPFVWRRKRRESLRRAERLVEREEWEET